MQALQLVSWKHEPEIREVSEPDPAPGQVLVRVAGSGACHSDLHLIHDFDEGMVGFSPPFTLGHENAGWVEAMGAGVTGWEQGQPVAVYGPTGCGRCRRCQAGIENYCENQGSLTSLAPGLGTDGGMAPLLLVPDARHLVPLVDLDPVDAAPLTDAGLTPYHAVMRSIDRLVPGSTAVVIGAGGLGHMAVQILRAVCAATVVAVDTRASALELASRSGADHVVVAGPDAVGQIEDLTRGRGADVVLDVVGSDDTLRLAAAVSRSLGHIAVVGIAGGSFPFSFFGLPYEAAIATTYWGSLPELVEVIDLAERGLIRAEVERVSLSAAAAGYQRLAAGGVDGRLVVVPGD